MAVSVRIAEKRILCGSGACNNNSKKVSFGGRERVTGVSGARGGTDGSASRPAVTGEETQERRKIGGEGGSEGEGEGWIPPPPQTHILFPYPFMLVWCSNEMPSH